MIKVLSISFLIIILFTGSTLPLATSQDQNIPEWVRNIFVWYGQGQISESELLNAIQFLVEIGVLEPPKESTQVNDNSKTSDMSGIYVPPRPGTEELESAWNTAVTKILPRQNDVGNEWQVGKEETYIVNPQTQEGKFNGQPALRTAYPYYHSDVGQVSVCIAKGEGYRNSDPKQFAGPCTSIPDVVEEWTTHKDLLSFCSLGFSDHANNTYDVYLICIKDDYGILIQKTSGSWENGVQSTIWFSQIVLDKLAS